MSASRTLIAMMVSRNTLETSLELSPFGTEWLHNHSVPSLRRLVFLSEASVVYTICTNNMHGGNHSDH